MYTLEKHLEFLCQENPQYEILNSIWKLNKKQIPLAQSTITFNFPHYSLHEKSHSDTIIRNIESFLGENRIRSLSATDTWMLLMVAYTHDLGMVVFHAALEEKWNEESFQTYLVEISQSSSDFDLARSAKLLLEIESQTISSEQSRLNLPLEIRKAVILIIADFFRRNHHRRSQDIIKGHDKKFFQLLSGFHLGNIPNRFANVLADAAYSHGTDFYSTLERLEYQSDGFGSDKMHPRFIACMLRLGDLLDVDDKRFNVFSEKVFDNALPIKSEVHREKHASTKHLLISPESIEATVDCMSDEVYRVAREWFDWLQGEVENQSREWGSISPKLLQGMPPTISRGKLKVLYKSAEPKKELMNLRFSISNKKVFEMFEGSAIYEDAEFVCLRELVQNSLDASKIQLWRFIKLGVYDHIIRDHLKLAKNSSHDTIIKAIVFPSDLPDEIFEAFQIDLNISWTDESQSLLKIEIIDRGTGISEKDLIRMTQKVGESRSQDVEYESFRKTMPYWMQPTGAFGIGLQSLFLLVPSFTVQTKSENEEGMEIIFQSAKRGEYSKITGAKVELKRGTRVSLIVPKEKFSHVFSENFDSEIVNKYDFFTDKFGDIYLHKIKAYIESQFKYVDLLNVVMFKTIVLVSKYLKINSGQLIRRDILGIRRGDKILCQLQGGDASNHLFLFSEYEIAGSDITLEFGSTIKGRLHYYDSDRSYYVRDIPVDEEITGFFVLMYCDIIWNLQSQRSDKILNISRDRLIKKTKNLYEEKLCDQFLPIVIDTIVDLFEERYGETPNDKASIATEYFHMELTASMLQKKLNNNPNIYQSHEIPDEGITTFDMQRVTFESFFKQTRIYIISKTPNYWENYDESIRGIWNRIRDIEGFTFGIVIWAHDYFSPYLRRKNFYLTSYKVFIENEESVTLRVLDKDSSVDAIETNFKARKEILSLQDPFKKRRPNILPISPYAKFLAVKNIWYDGFGNMPDYSEKSIISPFKEREEFEEIAEQLQEKIVDNKMEEVSGLVEKLYLSDLVPEKLIDWVIKNTTAGDKTKVNKDSIRKNYLDLIVEMLRTKFDVNKEII